MDLFQQTIIHLLAEGVVILKNIWHDVTTILLLYWWLVVILCAFAFFLGWFVGAIRFWCFSKWDKNALWRNTYRSLLRIIEKKDRHIAFLTKTRTESQHIAHVRAVEANQARILSSIEEKRIGNGKTRQGRPLEKSQDRLA